LACKELEILFPGTLTCAIIEVDGKLLSSPGFVIVDPAGIWVGYVTDYNDTTTQLAAIRQCFRGSLTVVLHIHGRLILEVLPNAREINDRFDSKPREQLLGPNARKL
jgi:hypothetical protein